MKILIIGISLMCCTILAKAQINTLDSVKTDVVTVLQDERIDELMSKKVLIKKEGIAAHASTKTVKIDKYGRLNVPGYRIQVMNSTDRALVYGKKALLYQRFPTQKQYVIAQAPFFKLRIGNFIDRKDADNFKKQLSSLFPAGVVVVPDVVESRMKLTPKETPQPEK